MLSLLCALQQLLSSRERLLHLLQPFLAVHLTVENWEVADVFTQQVHPEDDESWPDRENINVRLKELNWHILLGRWPWSAGRIVFFTSAFCRTWQTAVEFLSYCVVLVLTCGSVFDEWFNVGLASHNAPVHFCTFAT